jgi:glycine/D-amino acid oxidase-like deaminating enzyme
VSRRRLFAGLAGFSALEAIGVPAGSKAADTSGSSKKSRRASGPRVAVVGAGAFGGWTALHLLRRGARVTLLDAWGPGNSRASSGGETRVIRAVYGPDRVYTEMAARAFTLWREEEKRWKTSLYRRTGSLWMMTDEGPYVREAIPLLRDHGFAFEELSAAEAARRYPQVSFEGIRWALTEKEAGYLLARRACARVVEAFVSERGDYRELSASPLEISAGAMKTLRLSDGSELPADVFVFACGPWLPKLFPEVLEGLIEPTRQEVFFLGAPAGDARFSEESLPVWVEIPRFFYGIPGNERRGFKVADDARGAAFDPTAGDRTPSAEALRSARDYVARRFPALSGAPLLESRVCQYENSPDHHFVIDRHPQADNVWLAGAGSGHGFKHGPAVGEILARAVLGERKADPLFSLSRFRKERDAGPGGA